MSHAYVSKDTKKEDVKSTAYTFTIVSIAGFIFLVLLLAGVLPFQLASYTKIMISVVMGIMFCIFFLIGVRSFLDIKKIAKEADDEHKQYDEISKWFQENYSASKIDEGLDLTEEKEQLYFLRFEKMSELINTRYPAVEEAFLDHILEDLYSEIFPD